MQGGISRVRRRELRRRSTDAEQLLWRLLRAARFGEKKFRRQHSIGQFILDFYCAECAVAVELDGGQHFSEEGRAYDERRTAYLARNGIRVLRFSNLDVFEEPDGVLEAIRQALGWR